jgi:hypothetical protein
MVATAASTALPPCSRIARPILEHSVLSDTTAPDAPTYLNSMNIKMTMTYILEIQVLTWDRHKNVAGLSQFMESIPSPLDNWDCNGTNAAYLNKC